MDASQDAVDLAEARQRVDQDEELLKEILRLFIQTAEQHLPGIRKAVEAGNAGDAQFHAHTIKGAASSIAAHRTRDAAFRIESAAREGNLAEAARLLPDLQAEADRVRAQAAALGWLTQT